MELRNALPAKLPNIRVLHDSPLRLKSGLPSKALPWMFLELPGWMPGERVKTLHVVCEGSSMHVVVPLGDDEHTKHPGPSRDCCLISG